MFEKKKYAILMILILFVSQFILLSNVEAQTPQSNVSIHVSLVRTFPNGSYMSIDAPNANVFIMYVPDPIVNLTRVTNSFGWAHFYFNISHNAEFFINITFRIDPNRYAKYEPKTFLFIADAINTLYENVYDLTQFVEAKQITFFDIIQIHLPGSVRVDFPESTGINVTVEAECYGLRWDASKADTYVIFTPLDISEPQYFPNGTFWYQANYTVNISFTTKKEGFVRLAIIDNATMIAFANPLYYVSRDAYIQFRYVINVVPYYLAEEMSKIMSLLEMIYESVKRTEKMVNLSVIPTLNFIQTPFLSYLNEENMTNLQTKMGNIFGITSLSRDVLLTVRSDLTNQSRIDVIGSFAGYAQNFYLMSGVQIMFLIIVALVIHSRKEKIKKEESRMITLGRNK